MEKKQLFTIILLIFLLICFFMSFVSKAVNWDKATNKTYLRNNTEIFPGEEGLIVVDVFLFLSYIVAIIFVVKPNDKVKYFLIYLILMLFIRFVLSMLFLAGDNNSIKKTISACDNSSDYYGFDYCDGAWFKSLKAAWGLEIFSVIVINICSFIVIFLLYKGGAAS